jgi:glutaconate CoA-transferase, subunit A
MKTAHAEWAPRSSTERGLAAAAAPVVGLDELASQVPNGAMLAVTNDNCGVAMSATMAIIRRGVRHLHLVCLPVSGMQADLLIGAGAVATLETSAITLGEFGAAPRFTAAIRAGSIRMLDATCPAIHAAIQAAGKGLPFTALRGMIGTDLVARRSDWKTIDNPFRDPGELPDPIVLLPAIRPDLALFHAPLADRFGNVFIGRERDLMHLAHAARGSLVTVERVIDEDLLADRDRAGATIPAIYVRAISVVERGSWPIALRGWQPADEEALRRYARMAATADGFAQFVDDWDRLRAQALGTRADQVNA